MYSGKVVYVIVEVITFQDVIDKILKVFKRQIVYEKTNTLNICLAVKCNPSPDTPYTNYDMGRLEKLGATGKSEAFKNVRGMCNQTGYW